VIFALETSSPVGGVALLERGKLLAERILDMNRQAARDVLPALDGLLADSGRRLEEVEQVALSVGPGSFTGLRIGLATALGLCFGTERRIVPVPTLAALALRAGSRSPVVPMLDARKGQVYAGLYAAEGRALRPDAAVDPLDFCRSLEPGERGAPLTFLGPGAELYRNEIESVLGERAAILSLSEHGWPRASAVGLLAEARLAQGPPPPLDQVELCYLRASQAELERPGRTLDTPRRNA